MYCIKCGSNLKEEYLCPSCGYNIENRNNEAPAQKAKTESESMDVAELHQSEMSELRNKLKVQVQELIKKGLKFHATQLYKDATGLGLKESKDYVDSVEKEIKIITSPQTEKVIDNQKSKNYSTQNPQSDSTNRKSKNTGLVLSIVLVLLLISSFCFWKAYDKSISHSRDNENSNKNTDIINASEGNNVDVKPELELSIGSIYVGGIIAFISNGHGLIATEQDQGSGTWNEAMQSQKGYTHNGFSDWRLPSKDELYKLYNNLHKNNIGNFSQENYWSSTDKDESAWCLYFQTGEFSLGVKGSHEAYYDRATESISGSNDNFRIRLVRSF